LDSGQWLKHFTKDFYPGLANVMRGRTALVGPQARTAESIAALVPPWQRLYHNHHHGLLQEALFSIDGEHHADDLFASDALAAMQQHDAVAGRELLRRYLTRVMYDFGKRQ
jgi:lipopolysaccharide/colanic/teichoic acid biosynthesis glycosyltransferase